MGVPIILFDRPPFRPDPNVNKLFANDLLVMTHRRIFKEISFDIDGTLENVGQARIYTNVKCHSYFVFSNTYLDFY